MRRHHSSIIRRPELSQHFLRPAAAAALVRRLAYPRGSLVVEPGAGDGALTAPLLAAGLRVIAVERDERLYARLRARLGHHPHLRCLLGDLLALQLPSEPYRVAANVPYAITAALVRKLLDAPRPPLAATLVVQREAAERFAGVPRSTLFALLHAPWFALTVEGGVRRRDFVPPPRVRSALLRIERRQAPLVAATDESRYRAFVRAGFRDGSGDFSLALRGQLTPRQARRLGHTLGFDAHGAPTALDFAQWLAVFRFVEHECLGHDPTLRAA